MIPNPEDSLSTTARHAAGGSAIWRLVRGPRLGRFGRALASRWPFLVKVKVIGGRHMYVDLRSSIGRGLFVGGAFDMMAIQPALDALASGATFVDVGANVGFYSVLASDRVGHSGNVYCFEIDPRPLRAFRKTLASFDFANIHIVEGAVSNVDGMVSYVPAKDHGNTRIGKFGETALSVISVRLDTWVKKENLARLDVLKIDVEGAEELVLKGAVETIKRFKPLVLCEAGRGALAFGYNPDALVTFFSDIGYATEWLDGVWTPTLLARPR